MSGLTALLRSIWAVLKEFGVSASLIGTVTAWVTVSTGWIESQPPSVLLATGIASLGGGATIYVLIRAYIRLRQELPDYAAWDRVDEPHIWQIACLWAGQRPYIKLTADTKAYPYLHMLKGDIRSGKLKLKADPGGQMWGRVSRDELRKYAEARGEKPAFLYPEER